MKIEIKGQITLFGLIGVMLFSALGFYFASLGVLGVILSVILFALAACCWIWARTNKVGKGLRFPSFTLKHWAVVAVVAVGMLAGLRTWTVYCEHKEIEELKEVQRQSLIKSEKEFRAWEKRVSE